MAGAKRRPGDCAAAIVSFVILGRSKERSDAAQTPGSMPLRRRSAAFQNGALCVWRYLAGILHRFAPSAEVAAWILGSALRFASLRPRMTKAWRPSPHSFAIPSIIIAVPSP
ncbi:hypothetical protein DPM33_10335 [Mesorhizobium hawassense]|uniref:Uncharacterized protein n=1 Tax=Mesorhizobium hawassense TaxID=1209954 RepID=A0A330I143_9HYPH|nr:hypothetical protein DPM33_10335 [Mesorhizobium hawassense]